MTQEPEITTADDEFNAAHDALDALFAASNAHNDGTLRQAEYDEVSNALQTLSIRNDDLSALLAEAGEVIADLQKVELRRDPMAEVTAGYAFTASIPAGVTERAADLARRIREVG